MSQVCFSLSVCSFCFLFLFSLSFLWIPCIRARPPLSPSFHPHSWLSDLRSVHGGCSQFRGFSKMTLSSLQAQAPRVILSGFSPSNCTEKTKRKPACQTCQLRAS